MDIHELESRLIKAVALKHLKEPAHVRKKLKWDPLILTSLFLPPFLCLLLLFDLWKTGNFSTKLGLLTMVTSLSLAFSLPRRLKALYAAIGWPGNSEFYRLRQRTLAVRNLIEPLGLWDREGVFSLIEAFDRNSSASNVAHYYRTYVPVFFVACVSGFLAPVFSIENNSSNLLYVAFASVLLGFLLVFLFAAEVFILGLTKEKEKKTLMGTLHSIHVSMCSDRASNYA